MTKISVSILGSDLSNISKTLATLESAGADMIHLDVMDGVFVPNITFGQEVIKSIRMHSKLPFDTHLMINSPENHIDAFIDAGCDAITFHIEATNNAKEITDKLNAKGIAAGISIKPHTPVTDIKHLLPNLDRVLIMSVEPGFAGQKFIPETLDKISELRKTIDQSHLQTQIFVDGGVGHDNAANIVSAGANVLVAASAVLKDGNYSSNIEKLR